MKRFSQSALTMSAKNTLGCKPLHHHPTTVQRTEIVSVPFPQEMEVTMTNPVICQNPLKGVKNEHMSLNHQVHQYQAPVTLKTPCSHQNLGSLEECESTN